MDSKTFSFLKATLGADGATAMRRAVQKDSRLEHYLVPRTLLGWIVAKSQYEGLLPGVNNIYINFKKSESGYTGAIGISDDPLRSFSYGDEYSVVAELAAAMGFQTGEFSGTDTMLAALGKSVDALLKAKIATKQLLKADRVGGATAPGQAHGQYAQKGPKMAEPPKPTQDSVGQPKEGAMGATAPKLGGAKPKVKLPITKKSRIPMEKSELHRKCKVCFGSLFKADRFVGCMCWRDLAKHSSTTVYGDGIVIEFTKKADPKSVRVLYHELVDNDID